MLLGREQQLNSIEVLTEFFLLATETLNQVHYLVLELCMLSEVECQEQDLTEWTFQDLVECTQRCCLVLLHRFLDSYVLTRGQHILREQLQEVFIEVSLSELICSHLTSLTHECVRKIAEHVINEEILSYVHDITEDTAHFLLDLYLVCELLILFTDDEGLVAELEEYLLKCVDLLEEWVREDFVAELLLPHGWGCCCLHHHGSGEHRRHGPEAS